ncbi:MAG: winged helix-turn-helix domain-containing protein [Dehalococcoidia bacterium]|nr:winged helix-turn-helix domain-containing protein [Dehalococcoidia bacterium]
MGTQRMKRDDIQIIADMLRLGVASKTQILLSANLRHPQLEKYLDFLTQGGFLHQSYGSRYSEYRITPRGKELLSNIDKVAIYMSPSGTLGDAILFGARSSPPVSPQWG